MLQQQGDVDKTITEKIEEMLSERTGGVTVNRVRQAGMIWGALSTHDQESFRIVECADERTGRRFGARKCRAGRAQKIGGGGRNRGSRYAYQVWVVWN